MRGGGIRWIRGRLAREERGFTIVEVMVAAMVLVVGLGALMTMLITATHVISTTRYRQEETSIAREVLEDARGLAYTSLIQSSLASSLQSSVANSSVSGSTLVVTRNLSPSSSKTGAAFDVTFTACSLDSPADGYGNHDSAPLSGGSWCSDVASDATADSNPDDYKRVSVTVTPEGRTTPTVQQTILIYQRPVNGPAVSCLSTTSTCPGSNVQVGSAGGSSLTFNVTTTTTASRIQWLVNGNTPSSSQIGGGGADPYAPSGTSSTFKWVYPLASDGVHTIDGTYTITAVAYDNDGNSGTRSSIVVTLNEHMVLAPSKVTAGWNDLMGGVDVQWLPSEDQDVLYYHVYHQYAGAILPVTTCGTGGNVSGTSCTDTSSLLSAESPPLAASRPTCTNPQQSYTTPNSYWVVGVDTDPATGLARESTFTPTAVDANLCNHQPNAPTNLTATSSSGNIQLSWTAPSPGDPDTGDSIQGWRIYRWASTGSMSDPGSRYQLVGTTPTSYTDTSADPSGVTQNYCVTAVDSRLDESSCSNVVTG